MKDKKGNPVVIGSELASDKEKVRKPLIRCIAINDDVATFRWIHTGNYHSDHAEFRINQQSLLNSAWIVF